MGITILRKYKNELLKIIQQFPFDTNLFIAEDKVIDNAAYFTICLRSPQICFAVQSSISFDSFCFRQSRFSINFPLSPTKVYAEWQELAQYFKSWLKDVVKAYFDDINTPDLWQPLQETLSHTKYGLGMPEAFESFSDDDKSQIRLCLDNFRLKIETNFNPNKEKLALIKSRIKYLSDAVDKHNKFDWKGIAIATLFAIGIDLSLSPEQGNQLFQLFKQVFSEILYFLPL